MRRSLSLGRISGIKVQVHWSFFLLVAWIIFVSIIGGASMSGTLWSVFFVLVLFGCVVLHELGHALTAQKFNVQTQKITLLPIGGVASLESMPDNPREELLITVAGPAVNIAIALLLYLLLPFNLLQGLDAEQMQEYFREISAHNFLLLLFYANIILAVFNIIPAFPMDGGRILRALLSMRMDRVKATQIAAHLGQFVALLFFFFGLLYNPFLSLIAVFVFFGAQSENILVQQLQLLRGHKVREAMMTNITVLNPEDSIKDVIDVVISGTERDFVVSDNSGLTGILTNASLINVMKRRNGDIKVKEIMDSHFEKVNADDDLTNVFQKIHSTKQSFFPVIQNDKLIGAIDLNNINEFMVFRSALAY